MRLKLNHRSFNPCISPGDRGCRHAWLAGVVLGVMMVASCSVAADLASGELSAEQTTVLYLLKHTSLSLAIERRQVVPDVDSMSWETTPAVEAGSVSVRRLMHELSWSDDGRVKPFPGRSGLLQEGAIVIGEVRFAYGPILRPDTCLAFGRLGPPWQEPSYWQVKICFLF